MDIIGLVLKTILGEIDPELYFASTVYLFFMSVGLLFIIGSLVLDFLGDFFDSLLGGIGSIAESLSIISSATQADSGFGGFGGVTIGSFITSFGAIGLYLTGFEIYPMVSSPIALTMSSIIAFLVFRVASSIFTDASISVTKELIVGKKATVTVKIPKGKTGNISYEYKGMHQILATAERDINKGEVVTIRDVVGNKAIVE